MIRLALTSAALAVLAACANYEPHPGGPCDESGEVLCSGDLGHIVRCDDALTWQSVRECDADTRCGGSLASADAGANADAIVAPQNINTIAFRCEPKS